MTDDRGKRLETIRNLLSRAASTEFEAERDECLRKADLLQTKFQIEEWELAVGDKTSSSRTPVRREMDFSWYVDERKSEVRGGLWSMFLECATHCRCVVAHSHSDWRVKSIPVFGLEEDLNYLDLLFTNLFMQMISKVRPQYDSSKSIGYNVYMAKEAGMKYKDIAIWMGRPDWIDYSKKQPINGIMIREMKKFAKDSGLAVHKVISLKYYQEDFCDAFAMAVNQKLREMRDEQGQDSGSMALVLRDMRQVSKEAMFEDFPDMRPHPADCDCDKCHRCDDPKCQRTVCKERRKPIPKSMYRNTSHAAMARGSQAGREAQIVGRTERRVSSDRRELN